MKDYKITEMIVFSAIYGMLSIFLFFLTNNFISVWLGINVGLAVIPVLLVTIVYRRMKKKDFSFDWVDIVLLVVFVLFFPNTFYVITDLIHIDQGDYYFSQMYQQTEYFRDIQNYVFLFHVALTLFIGVYAGIQSMLRFEDIFKQRNYDKGTRIAIVYFLVVLSSIGIYIGRFLRFFSWDILSFKLLRELYQSLDLFALLFIILFTIMQLSLYHGYKYISSKEPS